MKNTGYAFPSSGEAEYGMTMRDYFAAQALTGACQWDAIINGKKARFAECAPALLAELAYNVADAMLAERAK